MKFFAFIFAVLFAPMSFASDYQFEAIYETEGFVTQRLLPFYIKSKTSGEFTISKVVVEHPCYGMVDLHRANLVHIYCAEETSTRFGVKILRDGKIHDVSSPLFEVKKVAVISSTPIPKYDNPANAAGKERFRVSCVECHRSIAINKNVTPAILLNAFAGKTMRNGKKSESMNKFYKDPFSAETIDALVKYINEDL